MCAVKLLVCEVVRDSRVYLLCDFCLFHSYQTVAGTKNQGGGAFSPYKVAGA
jgi:hypothetical protein